MTDVEQFKLVDYHWERTLLFVQLEPSADLEPTDQFVLRGIKHDPNTKARPKNVEFVMTNCAVEASDSVRIRFMLARNNDPVLPGKYQLIVRRGDWELAVAATPEQVSPPPFSLKRSDTFLYGRVTTYYGVTPFSQDGTLWFDVSAKNLPRAFGHQAKDNWRQAASLFASESVNLMAVNAHRVFKAVFPFHENKIIFTSDSRSNLTGNMEPLYKRMEQRGLFETYKPVFIFKAERRQGKRRGLFSYIRLAYHLATSGTVICDDYQSYLYHVKYRPGVRLVQLWHACGAFKTVGFGRVGTLDAVSPFSNEHRNYTDVVVASDHDVPIYAEAFGIADSCVKPYGIPRHDWLLDPSWQQEHREEFARLFPQAQDKKIIVFAPTFRGVGRNEAYYDYDRLDFNALATFCRENGYFFIIKMHPFVLNKAPLPKDSQDVFADGSSIREINDILPSTDILITDYSSVVYEAALLDIPTIYFAYDLEDYISSRSFYEPYEEFVSGKIVRTSEDLLAAIAAGDFDRDRLEEFRARNFKHLDGGACDRIIDHILLDRPEQDVPEDA